MRLRLASLPIVAALLLAPALASAARAPMPGVPAIQRPFAKLRPTAQFQIGKTADWVELTLDAVWVGSTGPNAVTRIDPRTNRKLATVELPGQPCAGLVAGFGFLWVPLCGKAPGLAQVDLKTNRLVAVLPIGPAASEGGIAASADSLWLVTDRAGTLVRIDPKTGRVRQRIAIAAGSYNPLLAGGVVWVSDVEAAQVTAVDANSGKVLGVAATGPHPRFLTAGAGSVWTLNQGDGSLTRIAPRSRKAVATIALGTPGHGGDIAWGGGRIWTTMSGVPLTATNPKSNRPERQWVGPGGDSLKVGFGAVWLTDYDKGTLARLPLSRLRR
jgi:virginiamycin B lyase